MKEMWNNRYGAEGYAYGTEPNVFFQQALTKYKPSGSMLLPCEGEGRNAVFAASTGLEITAFDLSKEGKNKAEKLAARSGE